MIPLDIKEYLNQIRYIDNEISAHLEERDRLRQAIELKTTSYNDNKVQETNASRFDDKYTKYIDMADIINEKIDDLVDLKMKISSEIDMLDKPEYRVVLRQRYINLKSFEEIAVFMCYDIRQIHRIHGNALQNMSLNVMECQ